MAKGMFTSIGTALGAPPGPQSRERQPSRSTAPHRPAPAPPLHSLTSPLPAPNELSHSNPKPLQPVPSLCPWELVSSCTSKLQSLHSSAGVTGQWHTGRGEHLQDPSGLLSLPCWVTREGGESEVWQWPPSSHGASNRCWVCPSQQRGAAEPSSHSSVSVGNLGLGPLPYLMSPASLVPPRTWLLSGWRIWDPS